MRPGALASICGRRGTLHPDFAMGSPAQKRTLAADQEQCSFFLAWQRGGGRREQNTGGTPMLLLTDGRAYLLAEGVVLPRVNVGA